jgi:hypothetical protein
MSTSSATTYGVGRALDYCLDRGVLLCDVHGNNVGKIECDPEEYPGDLSWGITDPGHAVFLTRQWAELTVPEL